MVVRIVMRIGAIVAALAFGATAFAATNAFGPKTYTMAAGKPQTFDDAFTVDTGDACGGRAYYVLVVENTGMASATVAFNGTTLLSASDFPGPASRELFVTPLAGNHLTVTLNGGQPGSSIRLTLQRRIEATVIGPKSVTIDHGKAADAATFTADANGAYTLLLQNNGVSNATVSINGNPVFTPSEFSTGTNSLVRRIAASAGANQIGISVSGSNGATLTWTLFHELDDSVCNPHVTIDTPPNGATVTTRRILITGTATGSRDLGVAVNGQPAEIDLASTGTTSDPFHWFVSVEPSPGPVTLHAAATNSAGGKGTDEHNVLYAPAEETVLIRPVPEGGAGPLTVNFDFSSSVVGPVTRYEFDLDGDGIYERSVATRPSELTTTFNVPGTITTRARVVTADGRIIGSTALVAVHSFPEEDQIIRATWSRFLAAMAAGDVEGALAQLPNDETRGKYRSSLQALGSSRLPAFAAAVQDIRTIWIRGNLAHYLMVKTELGESYGYHVYFVRGNDGLWHVLQF